MFAISAEVAWPTVHTSDHVCHPRQIESRTGSAGFYEIILQSFAHQGRLGAASCPRMFLQALKQELRNADRDALRRHSVRHWHTCLTGHVEWTVRAALKLDSRGRLSRAYAEYTIFPPTKVATTFPISCHPSKGVFLDFECDLEASNVHFFFGSKMVTSATDPRTSEPRPRRSKQRAGPAVKSSTASASADSSPVMPNAARSNSISFSWAAWGA